MLSISVKHGAKQLEVSVPSDGKVQAVHDALEQATGVFSRKMKLVFKGKVLDPSKGIAVQQLKAGSKLMMLASDGSVVTKGQVVAQSVKQQQQEEAAAKIQSAFDTARGIAPQASTKSASESRPQANASDGNASIASLAKRRATWAKTGIISLRDLGLKDIPEAVLAVADTAGDEGLRSARLADLSCNQLATLPLSVGALTGLHTLKLSSNHLVPSGMPWDSLAALSCLTSLELDSNQLDSIPDFALSPLTALKRLALSANKLSTLPSGVGELKQLEALLVDDNQLSSLPESLSGCTDLIELSACSNALSAIPPSFSNLGRLHIMRLDRNRISSVPTSVLQGCTALHTLSLITNPITVERLRETEGFKEYDERRRAKCTKQMEGRAMFDSSKSFAEGADEAEWSHWHSDANPRQF